MRNWLILFFCLISICAYAQDLSGIDPVYYDYDPRLTAMGGASVALPGSSPAALIFNPAALAELQDNYLFQFTNSSYLDLLSYNYAGFTWRQKNGSALSVAIDFSGDEIMTEYEMILSWSGKADILYSGSSITDKINLGANLKLMGSSFGNNENGAYYDENGFNHQVQGNSYGFALDWGLQYKLNDQHRLGLMNRNLLNTVFWNSDNEVDTAQGEYNESRPVSLIWGYSYSQGPAVLCLDYDLSLYEDRKNYLKSGLEVNFFDNILSLRTGLSTELYSLETTQINFGCGMNFMISKKMFQLDIAYRIFSRWQGYNNLLFGLKIAI